MKNKKIIIISLCLLAYMVFIINRYQHRNEAYVSHPQEEQVQIVASFYPMYMHLKELTKGVPVHVTNMASSQVGCLHDYQLRVEDMKTLQQADILVANGFGAESFITKAYEQNQHLQMINASEELEHILGYEEGHMHEEHDHEYHEHEEEKAGFEENHVGHNHANEHVWVSIEGSISQVKTIAKGLKELDPMHKEAYEANEERYLNALEELKAQVDDELSSLRGKPIALVHNSFEYLVEELGMEVIATISGESEEAPTAKDIERIIASLEDRDIHTLFTEPQYKSLGIVHTITQETKSTLYELDSFVTEVDNLEPEQIEYVERMKKNIEVLKEAYGL